MGCSPSKQAPRADSRGAAIKSRLTSVAPVKMNTRRVDRDAVLTQRASALNVSLQASTASSFLSRQPTMVALESSIRKGDESSGPSLSASLASQPRSNRMSRIGTFSRGAIVAGIQQASSSPARGATLARGNSAVVGLNARLKSLSMVSVEMEGDGNCQFRSLADQLFGSQRHHALVRNLTTKHMRSHSDFFGMYFEDGACRGPGPGPDPNR